MQLFSLPSILATLLVADDGAKEDLLIIAGFIGKMPVLLNPDCMAAVFMDFFHAGQKTSQKSCLGILHPTDVNRYSISPVFQAFLKFAKGVESKGCTMWEVCAGIASTWILFATISLIKHKLYIWLLWLSRRSMFTFSSLLLHLSQLTHFKTYS